MEGAGRTRPLVWGIKHSLTAGGRCKVTGQAGPANQEPRAGAGGLHGGAAGQPAEIGSPMSVLSPSAAVGIPRSATPGTGTSTSM